MRTSLFLFVLLASGGSFAQTGVGVDVASPQEKLDVAGRLHLSSETTAGAPTGGAGTIRWNGLSGQFQGWDGAAWVPFGPGTEVDPTWDGSALFTGATWRGGDVGLGMTAAPNSKLQVVGRAFVDNSANAHAIAGDPALTVDGALSEDILRVRDVGANNRLLVNSAGLVGISTSTPTARLSIATIGSQAELGGTAASATFKSNTGPLGNVAGNTLKLASIGFTSTLENVSLGVQALRTANGTSSATTAIGLKFDVDAISPVNNSEIWLTNGGNIGIGTSAPHASALLDVDATALPAAGKRGLLIPRMITAERTAIPTPATGLLVYDSSLNAFWFFDGTAWTPLGGGTEVDPTWDGSAVFTGATWRNGDVGLGMTAAPNSKLQVVGRVFIDNSANVHAIAGNPALTVDGALSEDILRVRDVGANNRLLVTSGGLVGISTSIPTARLSIATIGSQAELGGTAASTTFKSNTGSLGTIAGNTLKLASFGFTTNGVTENVSLGIEALRMVAGTTVTTSAIGLKFDMNATSPLNNSEIWLTNAGNIGIGTNAPTAVLDVNGKARSTAIYGFDSSVGTTTTTSTTLVFNTALSATVAVQTDDIIKVDCACNLSNSTTAVTYMTVDNSAGTGNWVQTPNSIVSTGTGFHGGYSTGIFQATANGNVTFQAQWRVGAASTGSAQNCNITAVVIGKQ